MWLKLTETQRNYTSPISCCSDCPSSGSLIFGGQMVHINEGKGKLDLFNTKDNVLLTPHPSYSSAIDLFPFLILLFSFNFYPRTHLPYIDPTSTLHGPHNDPTPNFFFPPPHFYCFPPPQPPPRFYCFPLLPPPPPHTTFLLFFVEDRVIVGSM